MLPTRSISLIAALWLALPLGAQGLLVRGSGGGGASPDFCSSITATNLDICVQMDEGTGTTVTDDSGNARNGTFVASAADPSWTTDSTLDVVEFDTDDSIQFGDILDKTADDAFSMFVVLKPSSIAAGEQDLFTKIDRFTPFRGYQLSRSGAAIKVYISSTAGTNSNAETTTTTPLSTTAWHVVGFTYDGSNASSGLKLYHNGEEETTTVDLDTLVAAAPLDSIRKLTLGARDGSTFGAAMVQRGAWMHGKELSAAEVESDYCAVRAALPEFSLPDTSGGC